MTGSDPLIEWRKEFPKKTTYLVSHSLGAMPRRTAHALQEFAEMWAARGVRAWEEGWWGMAVTVGDLIGSIIGARPVHADGVDFATGGSVKWLCGGPGAGYLYVRSGLRPQLQPVATGWMARRHPFGFEPGPIDFADDAFRFLNGTPNIPDCTPHGRDLKS